MGLVDVQPQNQMGQGVDCAREGFEYQREREKVGYRTIALHVFLAIVASNAQRRFLPQWLARDSAAQEKIAGIGLEPILK